MPVGTQGVVKTLTSLDLEHIGATVILANTYHLMLRPGADLVEQLGGLHRFTGWTGHFLTDSGGFQVFSLNPKVDDAGATFRAAHDGALHHLSPERAVTLQSALGADIQMALDVCPPLPSTPRVLREAVDRTTSWAERARARVPRPGQCRRPDRRADSTRPSSASGRAARTRRCGRRARSQIAALGFDGYGIGGLSVGESRDEMLPALAAAVAHLPADQLRYLMGVGDPAGMVEAVALGVDMFDCVLPTRLGRHGTVLGHEGTYHLRNVRYTADEGPLDEPLWLSDVRPLDPRLCAAPDPGRRAHRRSTDHRAQPLVDPRSRAAGCGRPSASGTFGAFRSDILAVWG